MGCDLWDSTDKGDALCPIIENSQYNWRTKINSAKNLDMAHIDIFIDQQKGKSNKVLQSILLLYFLI